MPSRQAKCKLIVALGFLTTLFVPHISYAITFVHHNLSQMSGSDDLYVSSCSPSCSMSNAVITGTAGHQVTVYVIADFPQAEQGAQFNVTYDPTVLTYTSVANGSSVSSWTSPSAFQISSSGNSAVEDFQFSASSPAGAIAPGSGTLQIAAITFTVNSTPSTGSSVLNLSFASFVNVDYSSPTAPTLSNGTFTLSGSNVTIAGSASPSSGGTITCNSTTPCSLFLTPPVSVAFSEVPNSGYSLVNWTETGSTNCNGSTNSSCTDATVSANTVATANYDVQLSYAANPAPDATVTCALVAGGACPSSGSYIAPNTPVIFTVSSINSSYDLSGWSVSCSSSTSTTCTYTVTTPVSVTANLVLLTAPSILITSPSGGTYTVTAPAAANFTASSPTGNPVPTVQWCSCTSGCSAVGSCAAGNPTPCTCLGSNWSAVSSGSGQTSVNYSISPTISSMDQTQFGVVATNSQGSAASSVVTLTVDYPPSITSQPAPTQTVNAGSPVSFSVTATSGEPSTINYQWQKSINGGAYNNVGTNTNSYTIASTTAADNGDNIKCVVSNGAGGGVTSNVVNLVVDYVPILTAPANQSVNAGTNVSLTVGVNANPAATGFQWEVSTNNGGNFNNIVGATSPTYAFTSDFSENQYQYECAVMNAVNTTTSTPMTLTVYVNGVCGSAAQTYPYNQEPSSFTSNQLCSAGTPPGSPVTPPAAGKSVSWTCTGVYGGASPTCTAKQNPPVYFRW